MVRGAVKNLIQRQRKRLSDAKKAHRRELVTADQLAIALRRESDLVVQAYCLVAAINQLAKIRTETKAAGRVCGTSNEQPPRHHGSP